MMNLTNFLKTKKAQLFGLEINVFLIGFAVSLVLLIVIIVILRLTNNMPQFILDFMCDCAKTAKR